MHGGQVKKWEDYVQRTKKRQSDISCKLLAQDETRFDEKKREVGKTGMSQFPRGSGKRGKEGKGKKIRTQRRVKG